MSIATTSLPRSIPPFRSVPPYPKAHKAAEEGTALPTAERRRHEALVIVEERDPDGVPVSHYRAIDTLARLVRNNLIDAEWAGAGDRFRRDFHAAQFDPLSALDLCRARGAGGREMIIDRVENARQRVWEAMNSLGGMSAPAGSVIWHVVGNETSLRDWALRQIWGGGRSIRHEVATGILIAALGSLSGYYLRPRHHADPRPVPASPARVSKPASNAKRSRLKASSPPREEVGGGGARRI